MVEVTYKPIQLLYPIYGEEGILIREINVLSTIKTDDVCNLLKVLYPNPNLEEELSFDIQDDNTIYFNIKKIPEDFEERIVDTIDRYTRWQADYIEYAILNQ